MGEVRRVPEEIADDVAARYHFRQFPEHWRWDATFNRLLFPVLSPKWERRGWVSRRLGSAGPKSLNEKERLDEPWLHWASNAARRVYLVEDIPSAERLAEAGHCAVASMGCHLADDCAEELIRGANGRSIYVTYDRDAVDSSFAIVRRLSLRSTIWAALLPKDIKDMTHEELSNWLNAGC